VTGNQAGEYVKPERADVAKVMRSMAGSPSASAMPRWLGHSLIGPRRGAQALRRA
jgi:hypothetical protein